MAMPREQIFSAIVRWWSIRRSPRRDVRLAWWMASISLCLAVALEIPWLCFLRFGLHAPRWTYPHFAWWPAIVSVALIAGPIGTGYLVASLLWSVRRPRLALDA